MAINKKDMEQAAFCGTCFMSFALSGIVFPQQGDFLPVAFVVVGGFQNEGQVFQLRMVDNADDGLQSQAALADFGVTVLVRCEWGKAVI